MNKKEKLIRKAGFGDSGCEFITMDDGFIYYFNKEGEYLNFVGLYIEDYLAEK